MQFQGLFPQCLGGKQTLLGLAVATAVALVAATVSTSARAVVTGTTIVPSWNATATEEQTYAGCIAHSVYECEVGFDNSLFTYTENPFSCDDLTESARIGMTFDLSDIPASATITKVELAVAVKFPTTATQTVGRLLTDTPHQLSCTTADLFTALGGSGAPYGTFTNWASTGPKTLNLGAQAVADVQQRLSTSRTLALSIVANSDDYGTIHSTAAVVASNRPYLQVAYSIYPAAPTNFDSVAMTMTSLTWSWLDQARSETHNQVRDDIQVSRCDVGPAIGTGNPVSCTETGLQPNTLYTRHPTAVDPEGSTDGPSLSVSTAIEIPASTLINSIGQSSVILSVDGPLSNPRRGFSGVNFMETVSGQTSGWTQINTWSLSRLQPNSLHTFRAQARNGDGQETPWSPSASVYTLARDASATSDRQPQTWYLTPEFRFSNQAGWGAGGVQYYRYAWTTSPTFSFSGFEPTWSTANQHCPNGQCTTTAETLALDASHNGSWYLYLQPFNRDNVPSGTATYGPFLFDGLAPTVPGEVSFTNTNHGNGQYTNNLSTLNAAWGAALDTVSGLREYQYALGTTPGGADVRDFTSVGLDTSVVLSGLSLRDGVTYYLSVRAVDQAGNLSPTVVTSGLLANTVPPLVVDRQPGDRTHRRQSGTRYNVDFRRSATGPNLQSAQYAVYAKPNLGGKTVLEWTDLFRGPRDAFTIDWSVNFRVLREGLNYVSVRTTSLDGLVTVRRDVFTITKDMSPRPSISGVLTSTFPHRQPAAEVLILGRGFKAGATVTVGALPATRVTLNRHGQLQAVVAIGRLGVGRYNLRVVNPNGLEALRPNKILIVPPSNKLVII